MAKEEWREQVSQLRIRFSAHCRPTEVRCSGLRTQFKKRDSSLLGFSCGQDGIIGTRFTLMPVTNKNRKDKIHEAVVSKTLGSRQGRTNISATGGKLCHCHNCPRLLFESF